ncbi:GtrA family protein [Metabacillus litoralis]|uniref:GtrA family protein n=1 Tax=Metabacillus litoralis TaxID=152268 RepID=UPI00203C2718|nr:GtrA family protein [Metabacillus litoralis]MCM3654660.1 GtrA family protein [Metabacillus litoralis]
MKRLLKFGTVGIFNTLITIGSFMLLLSVGVNYLLANIISYGLGVINSYYWNKNWVFEAMPGQKNLFLKFVVVNLITLLINTLSLYLLVDHLGIHPIIGQFISTGIGMVINYLLNKRWTFKK